MTRTPTFALLAILLIAPSCTGKKVQKESQSRPAQKGAAQPVRDVKVTNGPVVSSLTDTTALITWSTNVSTDTLLRYGKRSDNLDQVARAPWGGLAHRVLLKDLASDTTYYFRVGTSVAQDTEPMNSTASFRTRPRKPKQ
jgi:purple acid phosphatase-like protein